MATPRMGITSFVGNLLEQDDVDLLREDVRVLAHGDESERYEYIHPRANLVAALGKHSRPGVPEPVVFVTEMVAFFKSRNYVTPEFHQLDDGVAIVENGNGFLNRVSEVRFLPGAPNGCVPPGDGGAPVRAVEPLEAGAGIPAGRESRAV